MNLGSKIYPIRSLYELRRSAALSGERTACGRFLWHENHWGVFDETALLWPIFLDPTGTKPQHGEMIVFKSKFILVDKNEGQYYELHITKIQKYTEHLAPWANVILEDPLSKAIFILKEAQATVALSTQFFISPLKKRLNYLKLLEQGLERTQQYFKNRGFVCMQTPTLVPCGGVETYLNAFDTTYENFRGEKIPLQLPTSPEFALKKLLAEGFSSIFQLSRAYRNGGELSLWHEPEFIMLEWYRAGGKLPQVLLDTQGLVLALAQTLGSAFDLPKQWPTFKVNDLFQKILSLDLQQLQSTQDFYEASKRISPLSIRDTDTWDDLFCKLFMERIEPFLKEQKACFVTHYPIQMAALAAQAFDGSGQALPFCLRGEAFLNGIEICNAYEELTHAPTLQARFSKTRAARPEIPNDPLFDNTMEFGLPPCAGNALGIQRVLAVLLELDQIKDLCAVPFESQLG